MPTAKLSHTSMYNMVAQIHIRHSLAMAAEPTVNYITLAQTINIVPMQMTDHSTEQLVKCFVLQK